MSTTQTSLREILGEDEYNRLCDEFEGCLILGTPATEYSEQDIKVLLMSSQEDYRAEIEHQAGASL